MTVITDYIEYLFRYQKGDFKETFFHNEMALILRWDIVLSIIIFYYITFSLNDFYY